MADSKLSALTAVTTLADTDELYANDAGVSKRILASDAGVSLLANAGVTASVAELNFVDGVTSAIQAQLDGKEPVNTNLYEKTNILGTVSEAAGVPTGAIIEAGSNANGSYTKWADGTMICTHKTNAASGVLTVAGALFRTTDNTWTYPVAFSVAPVVSGFCGGNVQVAWMGLGSAGATTTVATWVIYGPISTADIPLGALTAIGRWF